MHSVTLTEYYWDVRKKYGVDSFWRWKVVGETWNCRISDGFYILSVEKRLAVATCLNFKELF